MEAKVKPKRIPKFKSIDAMARFWDTHEVTDFESELREVKNPFDGGTVISVKLDMDEAKAIRKLARSKRIAEADLIRRWVLEKIRAA